MLAHLRSTKESLIFEYLEKENIFIAEKEELGKYVKCKERKYIFFAEKEKNGKEKEENIWRKKYFGSSQ